MRLLTLLITNPLQILKLFRFFALISVYFFLRNITHIFMIPALTIGYYFGGLDTLIIGVISYVVGHYFGMFLFNYRHK